MFITSSSIVVAITNPVVSTHDATDVDETYSLLWGVVEDLGGESPTNLGFSLGTTTGYGTDVPSSFATGDEYIYCVGGTSPNDYSIYKFYKYDLTSYSVSDTYSSLSGSKIWAIAEDPEYVYIGGDKEFTVQQYWKSNLTKKTEADYGGCIYDISDDIEYIYVVGDNDSDAGNGRIKQYWKSNLTKKGESANYDSGQIEVIEVDDNYVYSTDGYNVTYQYWKSNMTEKANNWTGYTGIIRSIAQDTEYIYVGGLGNNKKVQQIWKSNLTKKAETVSYGGNILKIIEDDDYVYAVGDTTRKVRQYLKTDMSFVAESESIGTVVWYNAISQDLDFIYATGTVTEVNTVYIFDKADMSTVDSGLAPDYTWFADICYSLDSAFVSDIDTLSPGTLYHYQAYAENSNGTGFGNDKEFLTKPLAPTNPSSVINGIGMEINLTWDKGIGANNTIIIYNDAWYPTSIYDGDLVYNGTGDYALYDFEAGNIYYFTAWSYAEWTCSPTLYQYSNNGMTFLVNATGFLFINCFDEVNNTNLTFNVKISDKDGSEVYDDNNCTNTKLINLTLIPEGEDIEILISSTGYYERAYTTDIDTDGTYILNAYLSPKNGSYLYYIRVIETITSDFGSYDVGVEDAFVIIKKFFNTTGTFENITSRYTDQNGYMDLYLIPYSQYKVFISKTGFNNAISNYIPSPPDENGQTEVKIFKIVRNETIIWPHLETMFTNITYSFYPTNTRHSSVFTFWYNINSIDGKLDWFNMSVWYYNDTLDLWVLLSTQNDTTATGGSLNFTIPNVTGKYDFECWFKKTGYAEYGFGSNIHIYVWPRSSLATIPDYAWFIITIILMIVGMGFFMRYFTTGVTTGYVGLGIFAMMLFLKDFSVPIGGADPITGAVTLVSGWLIWGITFLMYTMGVFLYSRI